MGWDRRAARRRVEEDRVRGVAEGIRLSEERRRENEVKVLLRGRVEVLDAEGGPERGGPLDVDGVLSKGYGKVRRE